MNPFADKADISFCHGGREAGRGGRLWNALALRAGKGAKHSATLPRTFPAAPALSLSAQPACLFS